MEKKYFVMVTDDNHNRFYRMLQESEKIFIVQYGRVGTKPLTKRYPMTLWDKKVAEQIEKGYIDQTDIHEELELGEENHISIKDEKVAALIRELLDAAKYTLKTNYNIPVNAVSESMIKKAREKLVCLSQADSIEDFNKNLLLLYSILPRQMESVSEHLAKNISQIPDIFSYESDLLDVFEGQFFTKSLNDHKKDILDDAGITVYPCTPTEEEHIREMLDPNTRQYFSAAFSVCNSHTEKKYNFICYFMEAIPLIGGIFLH